MGKGEREREREKRDVCIKLCHINNYICQDFNFQLDSNHMHAHILSIIFPTEDAFIKTTAFPIVTGFLLQRISGQSSYGKG